MAYIFEAIALNIYKSKTTNKTDQHSNLQYTKRETINIDSMERKTSKLLNKTESYQINRILAQTMHLYILNFCIRILNIFTLSTIIYLN